MASRRRVAERTTAPARREILAGLDGSGLTLREFARQRGIPAGTLSYWRHAERARARGGRPQQKPRARRRETRFVEVPSVSVASGDGRRDASFDLRLRNGREVTIPSGFDADALARLVGVLETAC